MGQAPLRPRALPDRARRIGIITPSSNICLEPTAYRMLSGTGTGTGTATAHFARIPVTRIALDERADRQFSTDAMLDAARLLADADVDVVTWGGTAGSWLGLEHDRALCAAVTEATGIPATTSTLALLDALRAYGVTRLGLAVPYTDDVVARIADVYRGAGIEVVASAALGLTENAAFAEVTGEQVDKLVTTAAGSPDGEVHAVAVVCTNVFGAGRVVDAEARLGIPVLDSTSATVWQVLGTAVAGWGELLASGARRAAFQDVVDELLAATGADRTTLRVDLPEHGLGVDRTAAEGLGPRVRSIRRDASLDQRGLNTVRWLAEHGRVLVQPHFRADPRPPDALIDVYGVRAQVLAPLRGAGGLLGWLSVHSLTERAWSEADLAAVDAAAHQTQKIIDSHPRGSS
ncbi:MAG: maleate isomerase [Pseudonocardiales bacterium]|nr:maleate isomerase [Pseudonocardiales bacterium]